jgi:hypothetical protein
MASTITVPNSNLGGLGPQMAVDLVVAVSTAAKNDINALQTFVQGAPGTALTDTSTQSMLVSAGYWRTLPTLGQGGTLTLSSTGASVGDIVTITRTDLSAFTYAIKNNAAVTLCTFPVSKLASASFQFVGTDWVLKTIGQLA